jgi:hypothetical protein
MHVQEAIEYLSAIEVACNTFAWKRPEYECWVTSDSLGTVGAARHHQHLEADAGIHFADDYCLAADAVTCMAAWWTPERRFAFKIVTPNGVCERARFGEVDLEKLRRFVASDCAEGTYIERIAADLETGAEVPA